MTNANRQFSWEASVHGASIATMGAAVLILLGLAFQLGELGYFHFGPGNFWLFSVLASGIWNMLALRLNVPVVGELLRYWPLILVGAGLAILMIGKRQKLDRVSFGIREGDRHGE
ncbi:MAG: hypothetical protein WBP79_02230 [Candidatus Acidiferrales bacterium]